MQDKVSATYQDGTMRHPTEFTRRIIRMSHPFHALAVARVAGRWLLDRGLPVASTEQERSEVYRYMRQLLLAAFVGMLKCVKHVADTGTSLIDSLTSLPAFTRDKPG